jgi:glycosyltransferase involved in cell wall biosynthesis
MNGLRIGYLVQQFVPEVGAGPARVVEMAAEWMRQGAEVTVITGMPNRPEGRIRPEYRGHLAMVESYRGMRVLRSWLHASPNAGFAATLLNNLTFMASSAAHGIARAGKLDVLIASSPPFFPHLGGDLMARIRRVPLVLEVRDLWPDYLVGLGSLRENALPTRALFSLERYLLRRADAVAVVTESFRDRIIGKGVAAGRIEVFPNGVDVETYYPSEEAAPFPALERNGDERIVGYLGNMGAGQALVTVLEAAALLEKRAPGVRLVLAGDGPDRARLEAWLAERPLHNLTLHPAIPKEQTRAFYRHCDLCLVPLAPVAVFQETVPSKIFEILACERPVLASLDGEGRRIVEASGGGFVSPPGDPDAMAVGIVAALATPPERRAAMGASGRQYVRANYGRAAIADRYLRLLERVAGSAAA